MRGTWPMTVWCLPLIEPDVRISRIRLSEAVHRVASGALPVGMHGEAYETVMIVKVCIAIRLPVSGVGLSVFLPQPAAQPLSGAPLHFVEDPRAVGIMKVADPSPQPSINGCEDFLGRLPQRITAGLF